MNVLKEIFFELGMRKPEAFQLPDKSSMTPKRTLFIDDKKKIQMLPCIGISSLNLQVGKEDVVQPFDKKII
jgi:hypothetical protein